MTNALSERLGIAAYNAYYGDMGDWATASEESRERWRDAARAVAEVAVLISADFAVKYILHTETIAPLIAEHQIL